MKRLLLVFTILILTLLNYAQTVVPGVIIDHIPSDAQRYIGSPSLCILPDGSYVASHDVFGPKSEEYNSGRTHIFRSTDKGETWEPLAIIKGQYWSGLFVHKGQLYILGTSRAHGNLVIRRSTDGGRTWSTPYDKHHGLLREGEYHTAPTPVLLHNGRLWRAVEYATAPTDKWGLRYSPFMMSVDANTDLLCADNWRFTNHLPCDTQYLDGRMGAWIEGNAVAAPDGQILDVLRVDVAAGMPEYAAWIRISRNGKKATFDTTDFYTMPGSAKKFSIRYDATSERYLALASIVGKDEATLDKKPAGIRNTLALISSKDLKEWSIDHILLHHPDVSKHGFQYVDWQFEGEDIIFVCRTASDDEIGQAHNAHDANFLTFHRISNYKQYLP